MSLTVYLGIDVGSVTTKLALVDETGKYVDSVMLKTAGTPVAAVQNGMRMLYEKRITDYEVKGVGTTGSGRALAGSLVGADVVKNEITAHAVAASVTVPGVQTILEIGGQDSKIIIMRDGIVTDFKLFHQLNAESLMLFTQYPLFVWDYSETASPDFAGIRRCMRLFLMPAPHRLLSALQSHHQTALH
jgi:activator of 2-hydroxyglutaryl-CoA dehydratase